MIDSSIKDSKICIIGGDIDLFGRIVYSWKFDMIDEPLVKYWVHSNSLVAIKIHLLIKEMEMIEKYKSLYPNFETEYSEEIASLTEEYDLLNALVSLKKGENEKARQLSRKHMRSSIKLLDLYLLTFFRPIIPISS